MTPPVSITREDVTAILLRLNPPARVKVVCLPDLPPGGDIVEFDADIGRRSRRDQGGNRGIGCQDADSLMPPMLLAGRCWCEWRTSRCGEVRWLWRGRIPLGRITLLVGRPGEGKSFFTMDAASRVSTGSPWPDDAPC